MDNGQYMWDWAVFPDYHDPSCPWKAYIPLEDDWVWNGAQGWVFRKLTPDLQSEESNRPPLRRVHHQLKTNIRLTYRAACLVGGAIKRMYGISIPAVLNLGSLEWIDGEYEMASLHAMVWDARRKVLELYGWMSYVLKRDSQEWSNHGWEDTVSKLMNMLGFLRAPRRGCIIRPASTTVDDVLTLVRHNVPIHYQWSARNGIPVLGGWIEPTGHAARFDPFTFRTYDYAAYLQAGSKYNDSALDRSILG